MAFTTNLTTDIGRVRLFISDLDSDNPIFPEDAMIQAFLDVESGDIKQAAACAYEAIAGNQALLLKCMQLLDLKQDGLSTAKSLLLVAKQFREFNDTDWAGFDFAQVVDNSEFSYREFLLKQVLRQG